MAEVESVGRKSKKQGSTGESDRQMAEALNVRSMVEEYLRRHELKWDQVKGTPVDHFFGRLQRYEAVSRSQIQKLLTIFDMEDGEEDE